MSVGVNWQNNNDDERRHRRSSRLRSKARLRLVQPGDAESYSFTAAAVPADFAAISETVPLKKKFGILSLAIGIAVVHIGLAWWYIESSKVVPKPHPPAAPIEVIVLPPEVPPIVEPPPPPPPPPPPEKPKPKLDKPKPKPIARPVVPVVDPVIAKPPEPPAPPAPPAPVQEKVTAAKAYASYLSNPPPKYPAIAQRQGWEGVVTLRVLVQPNGKPSTIEIEKSSGRAALDEAAIAAVKNSQFAPAKRGDTPIEGWVSFPIEFHLDN